MTSKDYIMHSFRELFERARKDRDLTRLDDLESLLADQEPGGYKDREVQAEWAYARKVSGFTFSADTIEIKHNGQTRVKLGVL